MRKEQNDLLDFTISLIPLDLPVFIYLEIFEKNGKLCLIINPMKRQFIDYPWIIKEKLFKI